MKITKRQLRRIIKEYRKSHYYSDADIRDYLATNAAEYSRNTNLTPAAIEELLMQDFMDHIGAYTDLSPEYEKLIKSLSRGGPVSESARRLVEYSDYPSWADLADQIEDIAETLDMAAEKYVTSAWLYSGENKGNAIAEGVAEKLEQLYRDAESLGGLIRGSKVNQRLLDDEEEEAQYRLSAERQ